MQSSNIVFCSSSKSVSKQVSHVEVAARHSSSFTSRFKGYTPCSFVSCEQKMTYRGYDRWVASALGPAGMHPSLYTNISGML